MTWASANWGEVDAWCCIRGIDPLELPAYRLYNVLIFMLKEGLDEEGLLALNDNLESMDYGKHPFQKVQVFQQHKPTRRAPATSDSESDYQAPPPPTTSEVAAAEQRAKAQGKPYRVPEWWMGEQAAGKRALKMMTALPK